MGEVYVFVDACLLELVAVCQVVNRKRTSVDACLLGNELLVLLSKLVEPVVRFLFLSK